MAMGESADRYWATEDAKTCADAVLERVAAYREWLVSSGLASRMLRSWRTFYGYGADGTGDTTRVQQAGEQGELADLSVNQYASLIRQSEVFTTSDRPAFKVVATNTDYRSLAQAELGDGLLEFYDRKLNVSEIERDAVRSALLLTEGYVSVTWDAMGGEAYAVDPDTGAEEHEGEIRFDSLTPFEVAYDPSERRADLCSWRSVRKLRNKWDLAAQFPEMAEKIRRADAGTEGRLIELRLGRAPSRVSSDLVATEEFFHAPTPAVPGGRHMLFIDSDCVLFDGPLPYDEIPVYRLAPDSVVGCAQGHSGALDLLGPQEALDMLLTIATSNLQAGGISNLWEPEGNNLSVRSVGDGTGMNVITSIQKPEMLNGVNMSPEVGNWEDRLVARMEQISGVNSVARGEPKGDMSGAAMALLSAQAIQYHSRLQAAYQRLIERTRTAILRLLKRYATTKRIALIAGEAESYALTEFSAQDLSEVDRVSIESISPVFRTQAGRLELGDRLLEKGLIKPDQYILFVSTGRLEPTFEGERANLMRIRQTRQMLQKGIGPPPMDEAGNFLDDGQEHVWPVVSDTHWLDIPEWRAVIATPDARKNPAVMKAATELITIQLRFWREMDAGLLMLLGGPPPPPPGPAGMLGMAPMGAPPPGAPAGDGAPSGPLPSLEPKLPRQPKPPTNPLTGETWTPETGGMA